jgi:dihydrofolate synthase/folylpolyglutamate synthase
MNYASALEYIHSRNKFGVKLGLDNIAKLMESLGNPQDKLKFIHVAGTNGKGSTCAMLSYALSECGYKTGLFISPFVVCFDERIQINNKYIPKTRLAQIIEKIKKQVDINALAGIAPPTEFELVTAAALVYFYEEKTDLVIWEVGMGGRLDATNVISTNLLCVITSISFDHKEHLGNTLRQIAYEKACIIKPFRPCVLMKQSSGVFDVVENKAFDLRSPLFVASADDFEIINSNYSGQRVLYKGRYFINLPLAGYYQVKNLACVLRALELLITFGFYINLNKAVKGIEKTKFPGRFETIFASPLIIIDAAHNEEGIGALVENISRFFEKRDIVLFLGKLKDKDFSQSLKDLLLDKKKIYTLTPQNERAMTSDELTSFIKNNYNINTININIDDIKNCIDYDDKDTVYIFAGSIYLISCVRDLLKNTV